MALWMCPTILRTSWHQQQHWSCEAACWWTTCRKLSGHTWIISKSGWDQKAQARGTYRIWQNGLFARMELVQNISRVVVTFVPQTHCLIRDFNGSRSCCHVPGSLPVRYDCPSQLDWEIAHVPRTSAKICHTQWKCRHSQSLSTRCWWSSAADDAFYLPNHHSMDGHLEHNSSYRVVTKAWSGSTQYRA